MAKARYRYNIMLRPEPEGGYTALVPALPGCVTYGRTLEEAREMAKDAISGYIGSLRKHKDPRFGSALLCTKVAHYRVFVALCLKGRLQ
jgi:predicted RNase H-like HicB family nuclease